MLPIAELALDTWGVVSATVSQVGDRRTFERKRGGQGSLQRIVLTDGTGEVDLVLWDDEIGAHQATLRPGARVVLKGPTVKAGYRGGIELHLGAGEIVLHEDQAIQVVQGTLTRLEPTQVVESPDGPAFKAECTIDTGDGEVHVVCWGDAVQAVVAGVGTQVRLEAIPNPAVDGWYTAGRLPE